MTRETQFTISCQECERLQQGPCLDCFVTCIAKQDTEDAVVVDAAEARAMRMLGNGGLLPRLRHVQRAS